MNEIEIITINDILKVPTDKFDEFIEGFCKSIKAAKAIYDLAALIAASKGIAVEDAITMPRMRWRDDDKKELTINITAIPEKKEEPYSCPIHGVQDGKHCVRC
ncbi:MAG: hypothetical protein WC637_00185 [Victivallales bacterium]